MDTNFHTALAAVLRHEGGYVNHPNDPGGHTNRGITLDTLRSWRRIRDMPAPTVASLRNITDDEVAEIYRAQYWDAVRGDDLPGGLDYAVFDFAVNSGPGRAAKALQRVLGVTADGIIGANTLAKAHSCMPVHAINALCDARLSWLKTLSTWKHFGRGWTNRVDGVRSLALNLHGGASVQVAQPWQRTIHPAEAPSTRHEKVKVTKTAEGKGALIGGTGGVGALIALGVEKLTPFATASTVALAACVVLVLAGVGYAWWRANKRAKEQDVD